MSHKPNPTHPTPPSLPQVRRALRDVERKVQEKQILAEKKMATQKTDIALRKWANVVKD
jgi:hypothetical protein